jgi:pimeloyl-ACP methyl ester carboxylesterase
MTFKAVHKWIRRVWLAVGISVMAALFWSIEEHGAPAAAFQSSSAVRVESTPFGRTFLPTDLRSDSSALLFLPGGLVDPDAYVPLVRGVADAGIPSAIVELPWRAAPTEGMRAKLWTRILAAARAIGGGRPVVLAGHSRGGMFAATFAHEQPEAIAGLALIGTTHPRERDLSAARFAVLKILGSSDCVASVSAARANARLLPVGTAWVEIAGGNHRQFGYYGWQLGDCTATISRGEQHKQTVEALVNFVSRPE